RCPRGAATSWWTMRKQRAGRIAAVGEPPLSTSNRCASPCGDAWAGKAFLQTEQAFSYLSAEEMIKKALFGGWIRICPTRSAMLHE
ncbi:MAG: hypothetical protein ACOYM3_34590, partial [Terrimicrobiaceae bacterium]